MTEYTSDKLSQGSVNAHIKRGKTIKKSAVDLF